MTQNLPPTQNVGYLTVRVSTAGGAIPLEAASVNIRSGDIESTTPIYSLATNSDGLTPTVSLAAPPREASQTPEDTSPAYAVYNIDVYADGYIPAFFNNVPIFTGINSVQPAVLVPNTADPSLNPSRHITETPIGGDTL